MVTELFVRDREGHYTPEVNPDCTWVLDNPGDAQTLCGEPIEFMPTDYESLRGLLAPDGALGREPGVCWVHGDGRKACVVQGAF